MQCKLLTFVG